MAIQIPAHIAARVAARQGSDTKSSVAASILGDSGLFAYPRVSIRAGRYRLVEDGVETPVGVSLDVIIVGSNPRTSKIYYSKQYDPTADNVRPDCYSNDGIKPDPLVQKPVNPDCASCPNNVLGSKILPSGAKSKLCADQRHLAIIPAADPGKVYGLTVPVSAMKALRDYVKELNNYGVNPEEAITELGFDDQASYPKITFTLKGYVPEKALGGIEKTLASPEVQVVTRSGLTSEMAKLNAPTVQPALAAPAAVAPTPAAQAVAEKLPAAEVLAMPQTPVTPRAPRRAAATPAAAAAKAMDANPTEDLFAGQAAPVAPAPTPVASTTTTATPIASSELAKKLDSIFG